MPFRQKIHFEISERKVLLRLFDVVFVLAFLAVIGRYFKFEYFHISISDYHQTLFLVIYINLIGTIFEMYDLHTASSRYKIPQSIILTTSVTVLLYILTPFFTPALPNNRLQLVFFYFSILFALGLWRYVYVIFLASNRFGKNVVFVGRSRKIQKLVAEIQAENPHYKVNGYVALNNDKKTDKTRYTASKIPIDRLEKFVQRRHISEIVIAVKSDKSISVELYDKLLELLEKGIIVRRFQTVYENETQRLPLHFQDKSMSRFFPFNRSNQNKLYHIYSRMLDIAFSVMGLSVLAILIPFVWIINMFFNKGRLFYYQERTGKDGRVFTIVKLRTMVEDAETNGAVYAVKNDWRITKFGKFLRRSRIDEIPQCINVLWGEMAVIGPRPERPVFVEQIAAEIPLYKTRHVIKPGLTGWAQVNYPYGENLEHSLMKLRYDLFYIKRRSFFLDMNILLKTASTIVFFRGQ